MTLDRIGLRADAFKHLVFFHLNSSYMENLEMRVHLKTPTERNPQILVILYYDNSSYGTWSRILHHRGISPFHSLARPMTQEEQDRYHRMWRLHYISYKSWEGFIEDEFAVTKDMEWCRQIHALSRITTPLHTILHLPPEPQPDVPENAGPDDDGSPSDPTGQLKLFS